MTVHIPFQELQYPLTCMAHLIRFLLCYPTIKGATYRATHMWYQLVYLHVDFHLCLATFIVHRVFGICIRQGRGPARKSFVPCAGYLRNSYPDEQMQHLR